MGFTGNLLALQLFISITVTTLKYITYTNNIKSHYMYEIP